MGLDAGLNSETSVDRLPHAGVVASLPRPPSEALRLVAAPLTAALSEEALTLVRVVTAIPLEPPRGTPDTPDGLLLSRGADPRASGRDASRCADTRLAPLEATDGPLEARLLATPRTVRAIVRLGGPLDIRRGGLTRSRPLQTPLTTIGPRLLGAGGEDGEETLHPPPRIE